MKIAAILTVLLPMLSLLGFLLVGLSDRRRSSYRTRHPRYCRLEKVTALLRVLLLHGGFHPRVTQPNAEIVKCQHDMVRPGISGTCMGSPFVPSSRAEFTARIFL